MIKLEVWWENHSKGRATSAKWQVTMVIKTGSQLRVIIGVQAGLAFLDSEIQCSHSEGI